MSSRIAINYVHWIKKAFKKLFFTTFVFKLNCFLFNNITRLIPAKIRVITKGLFDWLKTFGLKVKQPRESKGMSQTDLASICNLEKTSISRIETGRINITLKLQLFFVKIRTPKLLVAVCGLWIFFYLLLFCDITIDTLCLEKFIFFYFSYCLFSL